MNLSLNPKNLNFALIGVMSLLGLISIGAVVLANNVLAQKSQRLTELKLESEVVERQEQDVITAKNNIEKYEELENIAKQIVPQEKNQARTVREIVRFSDKTGITINTITFPTSNLGKKAAPSAKPAGGAEAPKVATPAAPPISQVEPVTGLSGVYEMDVVLTSGSGLTFDSLINFLKSLESNRRTSQVSQMSITPDSQNRNSLSFTINFRVYIKP